MEKAAGVFHFQHLHRPESVALHSFASPPDKRMIHVSNGRPKGVHLLCTAGRQALVFKMH